MTDPPAWIQEMLEWADILRQGSLDCCTCLLAREDIPRLIELVGEMAGALDSVVCVFDAMNDVELSLHVGMEAARVHLAARQVLAKFRGEVENNG